MSEVPPKQPMNTSDSVRMNSAEGLPQYNDPNAQPQMEGSFGPSVAAMGGYVALRNQASGGDAYAVIKAFQDYMEQERARAQRRTMVLVASFAAVLAVVIVGFFVMWFATVRGMQGTQSDLIAATLGNMQQQVLQAQKAQEDAARKAETDKANAEAAVAAALAKIKAEDAAAREAERKAREEASKKAAENDKAESQALSDALAKMTATLEEVKKDNESLRAAVRATAAEKVAVAPKAAPIATKAPSQKGRSVNPPVAKPAASQPKAVESAKAPAAKPVADKKAVQRVEVRKDAPAITIKRSQPPKGFKNESMALPVGKDGKESVNWNFLLPTQAN